jgi:hypothetical protein
VCFVHFAREAAGASSARHSLRPLIFGARHVQGQNSRGLRGEIAELWLNESAFEKAVVPAWCAIAHGSRDPYAAASR